MTIIRTIEGKELAFELTTAEIEKAYREHDKHYKVLDLRARIFDLVVQEEGLDEFALDHWELDLPKKGKTTALSRKLRKLWKDDEELDALAEHFLNGLDNCDSFWESYWNVAEYLIEEYGKEVK